MAGLRKFDFGQSFDKPFRDAAAEAAIDMPEPEPEPEPTYTQADLDAAESRGFMAGQLEGTRLALERQEHHVALAMSDIASLLPPLATQLSTVITGLEAEAAKVLLLAVERLFPRLVAETGRREVAALLDQAFHHAFDEPRMTVRCPAILRDQVEKLVNEAAAGAGYGGKLTILGDPALIEGGCRVEWSEGGLERDPETLLAAIETALRRSLDAAGLGAPSRARNEMPTPEKEADPHGTIRSVG